MGVSSVANSANIQSAIAVASRRTGIDFNYLLGQAQVESGLRANARAGTSSASGLYQFIDQSWLGVVKAHGGEHGMGWAADSIKQTSSGRYVVSDPATRRAILDLRNDPTAASLMAAEHASDNKDALETSLNRPATGTDLYMAHFLGLGGARSFLGAMDANPNRSGASMFPAAARANRNIFYNAGGQPRTLSDIYSRFSDRLDQGAQSVGATGSASGAPESFSAAQAQWSSQALEGGGEVVLGTNATDGDRAWIDTTLANLNTLREPMNPMRPTPQNARLAYLMLARLGA
ncbi:MAG: lytic transglycosylase domain-containing protein [Pseudomonadota bacterium]